MRVRGLPGNGERVRDVTRNPMLKPPRAHAVGAHGEAASRAGTHAHRGRSLIEGDQTRLLAGLRRGEIDVALLYDFGLGYGLLATKPANNMS